MTDPATQLSGRSLIADEWIATTGRATFCALNPATGAQLDPPIGDAGSADVNRALAAAVQAAAQFDRLPQARTADLLASLANHIEHAAPALISVGHAQTALPTPRLQSELKRTTSQLRMFADFVRHGRHLEPVIDHADPQRTPPKPDVRRINIPLGPVAVFGASNFPFAFGTCGGDTASALAAGNPVIVKGHPAHPGVSELFAHAMHRALHECRLPPGMFALLQGRAPALTDALVNHPDLEAVAFTGSFAVGNHLLALAAQRPRPIPVFAEMGSLNPVFIMPAALRTNDALPKTLADTITLGCGQFCTKPGLIFIHTNSATDPWIDRLRTALAAVPAATMLQPTLRARFQEAVAHCTTLPSVTTALAPRASGVAGCIPGLLVVSASTWLAQPALHEEMFGPLAVVITCPDASSWHDCLRALTGQLTSTLHADPADDPHEVAATFHALARDSGRVIYNGVPTGVEVCHAMVHGGPFPATNAPSTSSVGTLAIRRFLRPLSFQNVPAALLPPALLDANPLQLPRLVDGHWTP